MPIEKFKGWLFNNKKALKVVSTKSIKDIGIFLDIDLQNIDEVKKLEKLVQQKFPKLTIMILGFVDEKLVKNSVEYSYYCQSDLKWAGYPESSAVQSFIENKFKRFYFLSSTFEKHKEFILAKINADFKMGIHHKGADQYLDFILDTKVKFLDKIFLEIEETILKLTRNDTK
jgi:hypothetical protein